jgi:endonuclease-3
MTIKSEEREAILSFLHKDFNDAKCALVFTNDYQCLIDISLSAQTTDKSVNRVTPALFAKYPDFASLSQAKIEDVESLIKSLGLYHNKAKNLLALAKEVTFKYQGQLPHNRALLESLPGVGSKTAAVFLLERSEQSFIPVDTHVKRIACRLGYARDKDEPLKIEKKLEKSFPENEWKFLHHALISFGRERCGASSPNCSNCPLISYCSYFKRNSSTKGKKS